MPFEALRAGTRDTAHFGQEPEFGTLEVGKHADLVLVDANLLSDVGSIVRRVGVVARGRWLTANDRIRDRSRCCETTAAWPLEYVLVA